MARLAAILAGPVLGAVMLVPEATFAQTPDPVTAPFPEVSQGEAGAPFRVAQQIPGPVNPVPPSGTTLIQAPAPGPGAPPAQPRGRVRIQGRDTAEPPVASPAPGNLLVDTREQMRRFITQISTFARRYNRNFTVIARGALDLIVKRDPVDETRFAPARSFMRSIDGVVVDGLFFDDRVFGEPPPSGRQKRILRLTEMAKANGLRVMVIDFGTDPETVRMSHRLNREKGYLSTTVHRPLAEMTEIPPFPPRPFGENARSVLSLSDVNNFIYIANSAGYGREAEFALAMHENNFDLLIVDVLHGRQPLSRRAVETLKYKKVGGRRLVFARMNIGTAASYQYYWKANWREGSPIWIKAPVRDDPDRYYVEYWRPEWQRLIAGDNQSFTYGLIAQGFDGVLLEGIEVAYRFFEGGLEQDQQDEEEAPAPLPGPGARVPGPGAAPATAEAGGPGPETPEPGAAPTPTPLTPAAPPR